jgi:hypothetical protein
MYDKHHPRWVRRTVVSKRGLKGALVVVDGILLTQGGREKLTVLDSKCCR